MVTIDTRRGQSWIKSVFGLLLKNISREKTNRDEMIYSLRYQIMMNCWQNEPEARPSFTDLTKQLKDMENQHKVRLSLPSDIKRISVDQLNAMTTI